MVAATQQSPPEIVPFNAYPKTTGDTETSTRSVSDGVYSSHSHLQHYFDSTANAIPPSGSLLNWTYDGILSNGSGEQLSSSSSSSTPLANPMNNVYFNGNNVNINASNISNKESMFFADQSYAGYLNPNNSSCANPFYPSAHYSSNFATTSVTGSSSSYPHSYRHPSSYLYRLDSDAYQSSTANLTNIVVTSTTTTTTTATTISQLEPVPAPTTLLIPSSSFSLTSSLSSSSSSSPPSSVLSPTSLANAAKNNLCQNHQQHHNGSHQQHSQHINYDYAAGSSESVVALAEPLNRETYLSIGHEQQVQSQLHHHHQQQPQIISHQHYPVSVGHHYNTVIEPIGTFTDMLPYTSAATPLQQRHTNSSGPSSMPGATLGENINALVASTLFMNSSTGPTVLGTINAETNEHIAGEIISRY